MEYFNSLVCSVDAMSIGKDMKVPSAYEGNLKNRKKNASIKNKIRSIDNDAYLVDKFPKMAIA